MKLYFAPGACSFVPHVALEVLRSKFDTEFETQIVKLHKNEHRSEEFLAINATGQVPVLTVDGQSLTQIMGIATYLDQRFPEAGFFPAEPMAKAQSYSQLAWINTVMHPMFTQFYLPGKYASSDDAQQEIREKASGRLHRLLNQLQTMLPSDSPFWHGDSPTFHDAYVFTALRWCGYADVNPDDFPALKNHVDRLVANPAAAAAMASERVALDTYKS